MNKKTENGFILWAMYASTLFGGGLISQAHYIPGCIILLGTIILYAKINDVISEESE